MKIKNKLLLYSFLFLGIQNYAQNIQAVGIKTDSPQETLHVDGTARVREMPTNGGSTKTITSFTATRNVVADDEGNIGYTTPTPKKWELKDSSVTARYSQDGVYQRDQIISANRLTEENSENESQIFPTGDRYPLIALKNSVLDIVVPNNLSGKSKVVVDYLTAFKLTDQNGTPQKHLHFGDTNFSFTLTIRIYKVNSDGSLKKWREEPISREFLYKNNVGGYFSKTMKVQYSHEAEPGAHYKYELMIGRSFQAWRYEQMNGKRLANTRLLGQARLFIENK